MSILVILLLTVLQFFTGFGILSMCKAALKPAIKIPLAILLGLAVFSIAPFFMQLAFRPLTAINVFSCLILLSVVLNLWSKQQFLVFWKERRATRFSLKLYELPFVLLIAVMVFLSAWRCYYFPPSPRDLTSGAEVIAQYAVKEKTMINSVFSVDLSSTNNQFKPPFITCLQIIYKYAGFPFGQVWLTTVFVCFLFFLYHVLRARLHRILAWFLLMSFITIPEMYGYTIMALFDYSNAVFFCVSLYFLFRYFTGGEKPQFVLSCIFMAIATYIRSETLILSVLIVPSLLLYHWRKRTAVVTSMKDAVNFLNPSILIYFLTITVYINYYLPSSYAVDSLLNKRLFHFGTFYRRLTDMTGDLLLSGNAVNYFGYFIFIFVIVLAANSFFKKPWNAPSLNWLYAVLVVYLGLPLIGHLFPLYDLENSTKRGLFKIFPLMLLFMANSQVLISLSNRIERWESAESQPIQ